MRYDNKGNLQQLLTNLDCALTGKRKEDAEQMFRNQHTTEEQIIFDDVYYLSDGGYSRIFFDFEDGRLHLTSESLAKVKDNWPKCRELIEAVERHLQNWLRNHR